MFARRFVQLLAPLWQTKSEKVKAGADHFLLPMIRKDTRKKADSAVPKSKDPKVPVRQDSGISRYATFFEKKKKKPCQMASGCWHPPECYQHTAKNGCT